MKKLQKMKCEECGKMFKGSQGLQVHKNWAHDPGGRAIRMSAAKRVGEERAASNRGMTTRTTTRRQVKARGKLQRAANRSEVHFCPKCGTNLEAVSLAMGFDL